MQPQPCALCARLLAALLAVLDEDVCPCWYCEMGGHAEGEVCPKNRARDLVAELQGKEAPACG